MLPDGAHEMTTVPDLTCVLIWQHPEVLAGPLVLHLLEGLEHAVLLGGHGPHSAHLVKVLHHVEPGG